MRVGPVCPTCSTGTGTREAASRRRFACATDQRGVRAPRASRSAPSVGCSNARRAEPRAEDLVLVDEVDLGRWHRERARSIPPQWLGARDGTSMSDGKHPLFLYLD